MSADLDIANRHYAAGEYVEAADAFASATRKVEVSNAFAWRGLGLALSHLGKHKEAIAACLRAVDLQLGNAEIHHALGYVYLQAGRFDDAIQELERALTIQPHHAGALRTLVFACVQAADASRADAARAARMLERAYRLEPTNPHVVGPYLDALYRANLKGRAAQVWVQLSEWLSSHPDVSPVLSKLHADAEFRQVIEEFEVEFGKKRSERPIPVKPQVVASTETRPCPRCGYAVPFGESYCPRCGANVQVGAH